MKRAFLLIFLLIVIPFRVNAEITQNDMHLLAQYYDAEKSCSDKPGASDQQLLACAKAGLFADKLKSRGWCYGPAPTGNPSDKGWHPCNVVAKKIAREPAIVFPLGNIYNNAKPGDIIQHNQNLTILYPDRPCGLNTAYASQMRGAEQYLGNGLHPACWGSLMGPTSDEIVVMDMYGRTAKSSLTVYFKATLNSDGSLTLGDRAVSLEEHNREMMNAIRELQKR